MRMTENRRAVLDRREALAEWKGFVEWLIGVTPRQYQDAARRAVDALPQRDRRAAKAAVLDLLPADICPTVRGLLLKTGPLDHIVQ